MQVWRRRLGELPALISGSKASGLEEHNKSTPAACPTKKKKARKDSSDMTKRQTEGMVLFYGSYTYWIWTVINYPSKYAEPHQLTFFQYHFYFFDCSIYSSSYVTTHIPTKSYRRMTTSRVRPRFNTLRPNSRDRYAIWLSKPFGLIWGLVVRLWVYWIES